MNFKVLDYLLITLQRYEKNLNYANNSGTFFALFGRKKRASSTWCEASPWMDYRTSQRDRHAVRLPHQGFVVDLARWHWNLFGAASKDLTVVFDFYCLHRGFVILLLHYLTENNYYLITTLRPLWIYRPGWVGWAFRRVPLSVYQTPTRPPRGEAPSSPSGDKRGGYSRSILVETQELWGATAHEQVGLAGRHVVGRVLEESEVRAHLAHDVRCAAAQLRCQRPLHHALQVVAVRVGARILSHCHHGMAARRFQDDGGAAIYYSFKLCIITRHFRQHEA